uniref:Immunoglobulin V-set domain-containing protein n=1 Tax=Oryzias latipes TaxID=8090 RepID=H2LBI3_ORYLA
MLSTTPTSCSPSVSLQIRSSKVVCSPSTPARRRSWKTYVFLYRRGIQISAMMMQLYIQRTSLFDERLRHGDVSLKIMNVTLDDSGTYDCFLPERGQRAKVQLVVSKFGMQFSSDTTKGWGGWGGTGVTSCVQSKCCGFKSQEDRTPSEWPSRRCASRLVSLRWFCTVF